MNDCVLVTGGAGFIGTNFVLRWLSTEGSQIINLDILTYAGNLRNLESVSANPRYKFVHGDIRDSELLRQVLLSYAPRAIVHLAAETHVDRSIVNPEVFIQTNITGTFRLLEAAREYWQKLPGADSAHFRFLYVSSDEVYGSLDPSGQPFQETAPHAPNSPYSASKAAADHFVRAYNSTYGLPILITHCSNNYGPFQFPEKLVPLLIMNGIRGLRLPLYGDGTQVRDWIYVTDHCDAIRGVLNHGRISEMYNIGGCSPKTNMEVATAISRILDELRPRPDGNEHSSLIKYVKDRPGHDRRYALNTEKILREVNWRPKEEFESGLRKTVIWYLQNAHWVKEMMTGQYREWLRVQYAGAL
jgi:dTDP-glucose 4,6-dehydratase